MAANIQANRSKLLFPVVGRISVDIGQCCRYLQRVGRGRKCLVSVEISLIYHAVTELLLLPVYRPPLLSADIAQCRD